MLFKISILTVTTASILILTGCNSADKAKTSSPANPVAAVVNGTSIPASQVELMVKKRAERGHSGNPEMWTTVVDQLTMQFILSQEAIRLGLDKVPNISDEMALSQQSILAKAAMQHYLKNAPVSDEMVQAEYEKFKEKMAGNEYKARHILVEKEADAKDIVAQLKRSPKAFASLVKEKSIDAASKDNGGDLGWFDPRSMAPEFGAAVAKLKNGQLTDEPVHSSLGYHVIVLEASRQKQFLTFDQLKPTLQQQIRQQNLKKIMDDLKAKAKIEIVQAVPPTTVGDKENKPNGAH